MHGYGWEGLPMFWGGWWMLLFWALVIGLAIWGLRVLFGSPNAPSYGTRELSPLEIAQRRYARGDISREAYLTLVDDLSRANNLSHDPQNTDIFTANRS